MTYRAIGNLQRPAHTSSRSCPMSGPAEKGMKLGRGCVDPPPGSSVPLSDDGAVDACGGEMQRLLCHECSKLARDHGSAGSIVSLILRQCAAHSPRRASSGCPAPPAFWTGQQRRPDQRRRDLPQMGSTVKTVSGCPTRTRTESDWWAVTVSNRRPSRCKRDALPLS